MKTSWQIEASIDDIDENKSELEFLEVNAFMIERSTMARSFVEKKENILKQME